MLRNFPAATSSANNARSFGGYGLPNHCMLFFTKIWTMSHWMPTPRCKTFQTPPEVDMCAPKIILAGSFYVFALFHARGNPKPVFEVPRWCGPNVVDQSAR